MVLFALISALFAGKVWRTKINRPRGSWVVSGEGEKVKYHFCMSIYGALKMNKAGFDEIHTNCCKSDDGSRFLSPKEVRAELVKAASEGKRVLPVGECDNFDYQEGCLGHDD